MNYGIYDDFKLKKPFGLHASYNNYLFPQLRNIQRC